MMHVLGGEVKKADVREYGKTEVLIDKTGSKIFGNVSTPTICWMSHFDISRRRRRALKFPRTQRTVRWRLRKMRRRSFTRSSSIRKFCTRRKERRCSIISCGISAAAAATGEWIPSWRIRSGRSVRRSEMVKSCWRCPARRLFRGSRPALQSDWQAAYLCLRGSRPAPQK